MRREVVIELLRKANSDWNVIEKLLHEKKLVDLRYEGNAYYMRRLSNSIFYHV